MGIPGSQADYLPGSALLTVEKEPTALPGFKLLAQLRGRQDPRYHGPELFLALYQRVQDRRL